MTPTGGKIGKPAPPWGLCRGGSTPAILQLDCPTQGLKLHFLRPTGLVVLPVPCKEVPKIWAMLHELIQALLKRSQYRDNGKTAVLQKCVD